MISSIKNTTLVFSVFTLTHLPEAGQTGFRQVKIMKEFVRINREFF